jgi:hypothetical protein
MIIEDGTFIHRQIHPSWLQDGKVTSQAFSATKKDEGKLSVDHGGMVLPKEAFDLHTQSGLKSLGVLSLTFAEIRSQNLGVIHDREGRASHCHIPVTELSNKERKTIAKVLRGIAVERGWQYGPIFE